ncbi:MAG: hypothetical protein HYU41_05800 [Candidatus Rokubacteria bacterium]|nr:hypothetical protein [Candidatus Rokubacteria bacterium]
MVTVAACHRFLVEEREDGNAAAAAMERMRRAGAKPISSARVFQELGHTQYGCRGAWERP